MANYHRIQVIDSHTGGEPTRLAIAGGPDLGSGSLAERRDRFQQHFDAYRSAIVNEPRGSDVMVGALLCAPSDPSCTAGVIFFNNVGYLGMCGHGTIGLVITLAHLRQIQPGDHRIETPVGIVQARLHDDSRVTVTNVPSFRHAHSLRLDVANVGPVAGDIAWGGNWFFLVHDHGQRLEPDNIDALTDFTWRIRQALAGQRITGSDSQEIDHIELFSPSSRPGVKSKNFVLCPGKAYDRSPCGTGTSAKLACLYADGKIKPGEIWRQESIIGSVFDGSIEVIDGQVIPSITGRAFITGEATLLIDAHDLFAWGVRECKVPI
jgi:4-hydroxyproline epimerase